MALIDRSSGEPLEAIIRRLVETDYLGIKADPHFLFDWEKERNHEVYKITLLDKEQQTLGLISLIDFPDELRIHITLIEVSQDQVGKHKTIDHIAETLFAFACSLAFKRGYDGFVSLIPKTKLIDWYQTKYGFLRYGNMLGLNEGAARTLIETYWNDGYEQK